MKYEFKNQEVQDNQHREQTTHALPPVAKQPARKRIGFLPAPLRRVIISTLTRLSDPYPEVSTKNFLVDFASRQQVIQLGWLPAVTLIIAIGLLIVNYAYSISRIYGIAVLTTFSLVEALFVLGILLMFVPVVVRLLYPQASRFERVCLLCVAGLSLYLVQITNSPLHFAGFDEFLHWRTAEDIAQTGHFFQMNTLLPVSPYYPGLQIVTNALSSLSGLHIFYSGVIVLGVARLLIMLSLFLLFEQVTHSARVASIATTIYMTNPHFIGFDVQYSYESLSIPIAAFMLFILSRLDTIPYKHRMMTLLAWLVLVALAFTHHVTNYVFDVFLLLWSVTYLFQRPMRVHRWKIASTALFGISAAIAVTFIPGSPVITYLSSYFGGSLADLAHVFVGTSQARPLFVNNTGLLTPFWDRWLIAASVGIITLILPCGLIVVWLRHRFNGLALLFALAVLAYPLSQLFRFTSFGEEIADRSAAFLFLPIAYIMATFITQFWSTRRVNWRNTTFITLALSLVFVGGVILQGGPGLSFLPGPYLVSADNRSVEPQGIQDALWTYSHLNANNRIATDRINSLLMTTYGRQYAVTHLADNVNVSSLFLDSSVEPSDTKLMQTAHIRYLVVDLRLSTATPLVGVYFESGEPDAGQYTQPLPLSSLTKFDAVSQLNREFDSGDIVIYDVKELTDAP